MSGSKVRLATKRTAARKQVCKLSRRYRVAPGQGRQKVRQAGGYRVQKQARVKPGRTRKRRIAKSRRTGKPLVDLETHTRRTGTERQETKG